PDRRAQLLRAVPAVPALAGRSSADEDPRAGALRRQVAGGGRGDQRGAAGVRHRKARGGSGVTCDVTYSTNDFKSDLKPVWCPGCGDFAVLNSVYRALADLGRAPHDTVVVSGIGCSSRLPGYVETYGFNSLHGRALPIATGVKLAAPKLNVIAVGGDGDGIAIGGNHFLHA